VMLRMVHLPQTWTGFILIDLRPFHCGPLCCKKQGGGGLKEWYRSKKASFDRKLVKEEDLDKMPSPAEIEEKGLPKNTPTLGERIDRDHYHLFHQIDEKSGYHNLRKRGKGLGMVSHINELKREAKHELSTRPVQAFKEHFQTVYQEVRKFEEEMKENARYPSRGIDNMPENGDRSEEWAFRSKEDLSQLILTVDSDWGEGYSAAELDSSPLGHAVLRGELSTRVPADGRTQAAGYVNIATKPKMKSFAREFLMEHWEFYTHLTMNVRGDGRKYMINLQVKRDFDILWNDRWHYPLFTRGGPYWQYVKIPWSKFYLGSKGKIQDKQQKVPLSRGVVGMSISLMDGHSGPFQLELKDISLHKDPNPVQEDFAYEMYKVPDFWAGH